MRNSESSVDESRCLSTFEDVAEEPQPLNWSNYMDLQVTFRLQILRLFLPSPTYQVEPELFIGFFKALHNSTPLHLSILISHFIPVQLLFFPPTTFSTLRLLTQFLSSLPPTISSYLASPYSTYHNARYQKQVLFPLKIYSPFKILVEKVCPKILFVQ